MTSEKIEIKPGTVTTEGEAASGWSYRPRIDITESPDEFTVLADMPGTSAERIQIGFENRMLTIHGKVGPRQTTEMEYLTHEYGIGDFDRELLLTDTIDPEKICAEYTKGVLTVHLPKSEASRPRRIPVRSD